MASIGIGALGEPAIAHVLEPILGGPLGHTAAVAVSVVLAYLLITVTQSIIGEIVPKLYTIQHAEGLARRIARPIQFFRILFHPFILVLNLVVRFDPADARHGSGRRARGRDAGRPQAADRAIDHGRAARHRRGQDAHWRIPPARAGGPAGHDADPRRRHRRSVRDGRGGAPALRVDRALAPRRHRGREPGPGERDRPRQPAGQADARTRASRPTSIGSCARRRSCPRPSRSTICWPTSSASGPSSRSSSTSTAGPPASSRSRTSSRRSSARSPTRPTPPAARCAGSRTATGSCAVTWPSPISPDYGLELPVDTDAYNSVGGFVFAELGRLPKRGDTIAANGFSIRVESVRQNRIEAVRIRQRRAGAGAAVPASG